MVAVAKPLPPYVTAELVQAAVAAAAIVYGDDPSFVLTARQGDRRRTLAIAIRAVCEVPGAPKSRVAALVGGNGNNKRLYREGAPPYAAALAAAKAAVLQEVGPVAILVPSGRRRPTPRTPVPALDRPSRAATGFGQLDRLARFIELPRTAKAFVSDDDRALIDAAIAAGKVTVLASGHAAGLSQTENALWAAPPPVPEGGTSWRNKGSSGRGVAIALRRREARS